MINDQPKWPVYIHVSAKAENTKDDTRTRETFSAPADFRELMSELDHAAVAVCADRPTVYVRRAEKYNDKTISDMVAMTSPRNSGKSLIISIDITKFSPRMNRDFMLAHHDMMLSMTNTPAGNRTFRKLWKQLTYRHLQTWDSLLLFVRNRRLPRLGRDLQQSATCQSD